MLSVLILLALLVLGIAIWAMFWAIRNKQFDNLDSQAWNVILDDDSKPPRESTRDREQQES